MGDVIPIIRAVIRCECTGCSIHSRNRCKRTYGRANGMHPIAMRHYRGRLLCHRCLNLLLERECRMLYSNERTWLA